MIDRCHTEKVTIGSLLVAALYFSMAKLTKKEQLDFSFDVDVDLRARFSPSLDPYSIGLLIGMINLKNEITKDLKFWDFV